MQERKEQANERRGKRKQRGRKKRDLFIKGMALFIYTFSFLNIISEKKKVTQPSKLLKAREKEKKKPTFSFSFYSILLEQLFI